MPRSALVVLTVAAWLTVGTQFGLSTRSAMTNHSVGLAEGILRGAIAYFGYFTLLTNILCAAILLAHLLNGDGGLQRFLRRPGVITTAATSIIVVGVVYHLLLASTWNPQGIDLIVDTMLHTVLPIGFVLAWTRLVPRGAVTLKDTPMWSAYIVGYACYIILRGELINEYPYPFIDVATLGYGVALRNAALLGVAFVALSAAMVGLNRLVGAPRNTSSEH